MPKMKPSASTNKVTACFSGSGVQAFAHFVSNDFLKKYQIKISEDGYSFSTPFESQEILDDSSVISKFICHGMQEDPEISIKLNGETFEDAYLTDEDSFDPEMDDPDSALLRRGMENSDQDFMVPNGMHLLIETIEYDHGELITEIEISKKITSLKNFILQTRDLDTSSNLSEATYRTGLLNGAEYDIVQLTYKGESASFELNFSGICGGGLYLVKPDSNGIWRDYFEIKTSVEEE
jgi:hypothetical protein